MLKSPPEVLQYSLSRRGAEFRLMEAQQSENAAQKQQIEAMQEQMETLRQQNSEMQQQMKAVMLRLAAVDKILQQNNIKEATLTAAKQAAISL
jgi:hypothetical protein